MKTSRFFVSAMACIGLLSSPALASSEECQKNYADADRVLVLQSAYTDKMKAVYDNSAALLKKEPGCALALVAMARAVRAAGYQSGEDYAPEALTLAEKYVDSAIKLDPKLWQAVLGKSIILFSKKDYENSAKYLQEAEALNSTSPRIIMSRADLEKKKGNYGVAKQILEDALKNAADLDQILILGDLLPIYKQFEEYDQVDATYQKLIALEPKQAWNYGNYANYLNSRGNHDAAIDYAKKALAIMDYGAGHLTLSTALYRKGADLYWKQGQIDAAEPYFKEALVHNPKKEDAYYGLGALYFRKAFDNKHNIPVRDQYIAQARGYVQQLLAINPNNASGKRLWADLQER